MFLGAGARFLALALLVSLVQSFPTADNLLKLAERFSGSADGSVVGTLPLDDYDHVREVLVGAHKKRLLFDPLTKPIDGKVPWLPVRSDANISGL